LIGKPVRPKEWLQQQYIDEQMSSETDVVCGCSRSMTRGAFLSSSHRRSAALQMQSVRHHAYLGHVLHCSAAEGIAAALCVARNTVSWSSSALRCTAGFYLDSRIRLNPFYQSVTQSRSHCSCWSAAAASAAAAWRWLLLG
jgi:hypothetical protein